MQIVVKTLSGFEDLVLSELEGLGIKNAIKTTRAVIFEGEKEQLYKCNYYIRTAISVLKNLTQFQARNENELYQKSMDIDWTAIIKLGQTFAVEAAVHSDNFKHSHYASLKLKDAIADYFRKKTGRRPDVNVESPDILINLHIFEDKATISINSSGEPLFKRGYRNSTAIAPVNEVLAAGLIKLSGWQADCDFLDPMCGSATIAIEAAMHAYNIPAGLFRKKFSFENWSDFDRELFIKCAEDDTENSFNHKIYASDMSLDTLKKALINIKSASLTNKIHVSCSPFEKLVPPFEKGLIISNPPYGERIKVTEIETLYKNIGDTLKKQYRGSTAWIFSGNPEAMKNIGLHSEKKIKLLNGSIDCTFQKYSLFEGKRKDWVKH